MANVINATSTGNGGLVSTGDDSGILNIQTNETTAITVDASQRVAFVAGTAALPSITTAGDTNTGIFFPAADTIAFSEGGAESMRIDSSGNLLVNTTTASSKFCVNAEMSLLTDGNNRGIIGWDNTDKRISFGTINASTAYFNAMSLRDGNLLVKKTSANISVVGVELKTDGQGFFTVTSDTCIQVNRLTSDGDLVNFRQDTTVEGTISVSGTTVSYNGGHLSRYAQTTSAKDESIVKGTVLSNLDEMNVYTKDGQPVANEQLNKVKVSDTEGDANVAGVFVNWSHDEDHNVDEINMAMTGDMIIRIAQGVTVQRGDLLMSAGDGTAKPQDDDIVRSKTIAKVTSNHVTCTYADGSYCVPCVLMAC